MLVMVLVLGGLGSVGASDFGVNCTLEITKKVGESVEQVKAWDLARRSRGDNSVWKTDVALLSKLTELKRNLTFMQRIGGDEGLEAILKVEVSQRMKKLTDKLASEVTSAINSITYINDHFKDVDWNAIYMHVIN